MKTKPALPSAAFALALLIALNVPLSSAFAQGSLAPPGAPGPTMLTLSQVEPRAPISSVPFTIANSGSYYLTTNLVCTVSNAIVIATNGVTLDLNGFTISSTVANAANGGTAILLSAGLRNITIVNGFIQGGVTNNGSGVYSGSGFDNGIDYSGHLPVNTVVSHVSVSGCLIYGIFVNNGDSTLVDSCTVRTVGSLGIFASTIKQSSVIDCGSYAIEGDLVSDCRGETTGGGYGIYSTGTTLNSYGYSSSGYGIDSYIAQNCLGYSNGSSDGIYVATIATGCYGYSASGTGISAYIANSCYSNTGDTGISFKYNMP